MNESDRKQLLDRIRRPSATVGAQMPEELTIQETTVDLQEFVFECKNLDAIPEAERDRIEETKRKLRRERLGRKQQIVRNEVSYEEGERLVESIIGIDRALTALEGLDAPDIGEQMRRKKLEDARELFSLVRQLR
ncbi:DUF5788 family protein [Halorussus salinus]|uniref:DUF5788 family protein n=1 Tax=Halorussus salinus TaxID=1364935 RepID=UPI00109224CF|nr:DUF5788 family protein [Halorussus salinus]